MTTVIEETHVSAHRGCEKERGGVSWGAVIAGAVAATALTLILIILGTGIGFASVSPWANEGASAEAIGISTVVWVTLVSLLSSAVGGYIAGRLRPRWARLHSDEVYFRDTAHGFLAWALATLLMATLLSSALGNIVAGGAKVGAAAVAATAGAAAADEEGAADASSYVYDRVFRRTTSSISTPSVTTLDEYAQPREVARPVQTTGRQARMEGARIFVNAVANEGIPAADKQYLTQVVAREAGITEAEASARIDEAYATLVQAKEDAKEAADKAADVAAYTALWLFISLLLGAFVASLLATRGGVCRDRAALDDVGYNTRVETVRPRV